MNSKLFQILSLLIIVFDSSAIFAKKNISDSLVNNLDCNNLNYNSIHSHIHPDAFNLDRHLPIKNWSFPNGPYSLGVCWSLSHTQRIFFYLARWSATPILDPSESITNSLNILNLVRGSRPTKGSLKNIQEMDLKKFYSFDFQSFSTESGIFSDLLNGIWDPLYFDELPLASQASQNIPNIPDTASELENGKLFRNFSLDVERYQRRRFHQFQNSKMVTDSVPRPKNINQNTSHLLMKALSLKNLPLVNIKANLTTQHILVVKNFEQRDNEIRFNVYDSNTPAQESYFIFDTKKQQFYAPEIIKRFRSIKNANQSVSVYIVDNEDQAKIDQALLIHYQEQCQSDY
jgi:hypothetical protein